MQNFGNFAFKCAVFLRSFKFHFYQKFFNSELHLNVNVLFQKNLNPLHPEADRNIRQFRLKFKSFKLFLRYIVLSRNPIGLQTKQYACNLYRCTPTRGKCKKLAFCRYKGKEGRGAFRNCRKK